MQLPSDMDPDEYVRKYGNDAFLDFVQKDKKSFVMFKVNTHKDEFQNNDLAYEKYLKEVTQDIAAMTSPILQKKYCKTLQNCLK